MKHRTLFTTALAAALLVTLVGCSPPRRIGPSASDISDERREYLEQLALGNDGNKVDGLVDITAAIAFVDTLNQTLPQGQRIEGYETTYDPEETTVFVKSDNGTLAIKLNEDGEVEFASATGDIKTKSALNQAIVKTYAGINLSSEVSALFNKVAETKWLNNINYKTIEMHVDEIDIPSLDTTALEIDLSLKASESATGMSDAEKSFWGITDEPVLTEHLEVAGLQDLSNYFESPSLEKFWPDIDIDAVLKDSDDVLVNGESLRDHYRNLTITKHASSDLQTPWVKKDIDTSITMPSLDGKIDNPLANQSSQFDAQKESFLQSMQQYTNRNTDTMDDFIQSAQSKPAEERP